MRIAIQGERGSFSHEAALQFVPGAEVVPCALSSEVFASVADGGVDAAVIPIENSLAGSVVQHYDLLLAHEVAIEREALLRIRHNLIAVPGGRLEEIRRVYSHPIALAQCHRFFDQHPSIEAVPFYDTAGSVKHIVEQQDRRSAAIASDEAARYYRAEIVRAGIEDDPENYTRFFLIRRKDRILPEPHPNKVSLAFAVENRPGTLAGALAIFAGQGINLTKIESRPVRGRPWEYVFYTDYQIVTPESADAALRLLAGLCSMTRELGRYRAAIPGN